MSERGYDDMADEWEDRKARGGAGCQCTGDMPGYCPGPASCPMCQVDTDQDDTKEAERIAADLAYNAGKAGALQRAADDGTRHEIMLRIMLREVS